MSGTGVRLIKVAWLGLLIHRARALSANPKHLSMAARAALGAIDADDVRALVQAMEEIADHTHNADVKSLAQDAARALRAQPVPLGGE